MAVVLFGKTAVEPIATSRGFPAELVKYPRSAGKPREVAITLCDVLPFFKNIKLLNEDKIYQLVNF